MQLYSIKQIVQSGLFKNSAVYTIAGFVNAAIPFLLLPVLTTYLTTADYGIITMYATVHAFLYPLFGVNMEGAVVRKYYARDTCFPAYIGSCMVILAATTAALSLLLFLFGNSIAEATEIPYEWILTIPVACVAQFFCALTLSLWQARQKPLLYSRFQILQSLANMLLSILFVVALSCRWRGRVEAILISSALFALAGAFILRRQKDIKISFTPAYVKHALRYGGGLIPHAIGGMLILMTNRFFLTEMVSIDASGLYGVANQVCMLVSLLTFSFNNAFVPWLFNRLSKNEDKRLIVKLTYAYFAGISAVGLLYYLIQPLVFKLFIGAEFAAAAQYCFWIILGFVFQGMYFMVTNYINYAEKTYLQALLTISIGLVNIPLIYFFIKHFGAVGAAISFSAIFFLFFVATWVLSAKVYNMPWGLSLRRITYNKGQA
ncbi:MAG: oligosaccharide flippase family protein [Prevotellaceae bacterium]|jgi:O-antigen/teichoic acid export membrane protein|nr:oligosaccharide flippase family protein [Prevotellaceae bacterium]